MDGQMTRRSFFKVAGVSAAAGGAAVAACAWAHDHPTPATLHGGAAPGGEAGAGGGHGAGGSSVFDKVYPFPDPDTGELLYHEKIRFAPKPGVPRSPRTAPVDLLEHQPMRVESEGGVLELDLEVAFSDVVVNGQTVSLRAYNGTFPGPTMVARPGDVLRIREINKLPPEPTMPEHDINIPHGFNTINLHTHGLNVSPEDSEDNVLLEVHPGEVFHHEVHIPTDHPSGTFWYHPHKHGSASCQMGSGMSGFLIIADPGKDIRSVPEIAAAKEVMLIFQEIYIRDRSADGVGEVPDFPTEVADYFFSDATRNEITVNGVASNELGTDGTTVTIPEIRMSPGEVQHWRLSHAGIFHNWVFAIDGHDSHILAYDGITRDRVDTVGSFLFVSGQRRDILVKASATRGTYAVKRRAYKQGAEVNTWPEIILFNIVVEGSPMEMALPTRLNPPVSRLPYIADKEIVRRRDIPFNFIDDTPRGIFLFTIDNKVFKPGRVDFSMVLDTAEEWTITNNPSSDHPFHIHVNWFEVLREIDSKGNKTEYDPPIWMDTANIPAGGSVVIRTRFEKFQGKAVFHCHLLPHEDEGMMSLIEMVDGTPQTARMTPRGGTMVSGDYENRVQLRFLNGSVKADTDVTYQRLSSPNVPTVNPAHSLPRGFPDFNTFFALTATQGGQALGRLDRPATLEVKYSRAQVDTHVPLDNIGLLRYDDGRGAWTNEGVSVIARADNLLSCSIARFGQFALTGAVEPCFDFAAPLGVGLEDLQPVLDNKDSPYAYFKAPYDIAPAGAPDGVLDGKDLQAVLDARGTFCKT